MPPYQPLRACQRPARLTKDNPPITAEPVGRLRSETREVIASAHPHNSDLH